MIKRLLLGVFALVAGVSIATAQGTLGNVSFANSTATKITNAVTMAPVAANTVSVGLYYSTTGTTDPAPSWAMLNVNPLLRTTDAVSPSIGTSTAQALLGIFSGGTRNIPGTAPGDEVWLQVRAWSSSYASYEAATASGLMTVLAGASNPIKVKLGGGTLPTPGLVANGLQGFYVEQMVPEPSVVVLGALGLIGACLIRRRK